MIKIDNSTLDALTAEAKASPRKRKNKNYHPELSDTLQRMLNAMEPGTYVQPHKHEAPDKREIFVILRGSALVIEFDDNGNIVEKTTLSLLHGVLAVEIPARTWHSVISLEPGTVVYEVKDGPYLARDDKNFAPWAPKEGDADCKLYLEKLLTKE